MTDTFHTDLDNLHRRLVEMAGSVGKAMRTASTVLLDNDNARAEDVIAGDDAINALQYTVDDKVAEIMATQQPVAGDLRFMLSCIRMSTDLERMGDMAAHVAKLARRLRGTPGLGQVRPIFQDMTVASNRIAAKTTNILANHDRLDATQLEYDDDEMDALYQQLLDELSPQWPHGAESAVDAAMAGRAYERFADHAVRISHQVVYLVTGDVHLDRPR